ncbi:hypothetical protein D3C80_570740 [compost metagenome]
MAQGDQVGHHQADEGDGADDDHAGRHRHCYQQQAQRHVGGVVQAQAGGHAFAHAQHGEALCVQVGE